MQMQLQLNESKRLFKIALETNANNGDIYYKYRSILLKETNAWFGYIEESLDQETKEPWYRFTGENWLGNKIENGLLQMQYPKRYDQFDIRDVDYIPIEHQSGLNQAILDAIHYFYQTRVFQFPSYSPITFK